MEERTSLRQACLLALARADLPYWQVQKRHMSLLPEDAAEELLRALLAHGRLSAPVQLDAFRCCLATLELHAADGLQLTPEWGAHVCSLRSLRVLALRGFTKLRDKALAGLAGLGPTLEELDLSGSSVTNRTLPLIAQLVNLTCLVLSGTSMRPPLLGAVTMLTKLSRLGLGELQLDDADVGAHIACFTRCEALELSGCTAGDAALPALAALPLRRLDLSLSSVTALPLLLLLPRLEQLDLSHCRLVAAHAAAAGECLGCLQELRLAHASLDAASCELLEAALRASAPRLRRLDATGLAASPSCLPLLLALQDATQLSALSLARTGLEDDVMPVLALCTALETLNLAGNPQLSAAGLLAALPALRRLRRLDAGATGVCNRALPQLAAMPRLEQLLLAGCAGVSWESKAADAAPARAAAPAPAEAAAGAAPATQVHATQRAPGTAGKPGWRCLQRLDVANTSVADAGCAQLAAALLAGGCQLRVLAVGGAHSRLTRRGVAALAQLRSLQHLTLQGCDLTGASLSCLLAGQLQCLHSLTFDGLDPWLVADEALRQLGASLPALKQLVRNGASVLSAPWQPAGSSRHGAVDSVWPAGPLPAAPQATPRPRPRASSSSGGTSPSGRHWASAHDERWRWTAEQLLQLRACAAAGADAAAVLTALPPWLRADKW